MRCKICNSEHTGMVCPALLEIINNPRVKHIEFDYHGRISKIVFKNDEKANEAPPIL